VTSDSEVALTEPKTLGVTVRLFELIDSLLMPVKPTRIEDKFGETSLLLRPGYIGVTEIAVDIDAILLISTVVSPVHDDRENNKPVASMSEEGILLKKKLNMCLPMRQFEYVRMH